ncbi:N-acetyl-1-D-myo-inositol-2-amino-2-deoxy-alpha-D-glucopyranoside deacetylase [Tessaracoccus flavus]|uniref:N-acetyl-1-D-myo-inositol-2-amino-2-deoxy-alpha- D-glucopyranoside deacetylase n=1 Tax=Tessaracoccus flavus TaxID=1610493 RepID=UPI000A73A77C|nr:N-acetyl-1-D-myo-inositol-2-amino-2-deoxy-alpha-D-glucopyranoside deacetylase [Tessaracoccus flavus]
MTQQRLLLVHAHPDDESSQSVATMARYLDQGAHVTLVTCTLGELGEIMLPEWSHFSPAELGAHRQVELESALDVVGVTDHLFLGGPGRYHDSGMTSDDTGRAAVPDEMPDNAFWRADLLEAANHLVEVIRSRRPQVAITYDPFGNYGHPDHIQAHRTLMYAVQLASSPSHRPDLGAPWQVSRVLWNTHNTSKWAEAYAIARERGLELWPGVDEDAATERFGPDPSQIVAVVETSPWLEKCRAALGAHRSQVNLEHPFWQFYSIMQELPGAGEAYLLGSGQPFPPGDGPATDVFEGIDFSEAT